MSDWYDMPVLESRGYKKEERKSYLSSVEVEWTNDFCKSTYVTYQSYTFYQQTSHGDSRNCNYYPSNLTGTKAFVQWFQCPPNLIAGLIPNATSLRGANLKGDHTMIVGVSFCKGQLQDKTLRKAFFHYFHVIVARKWDMDS